MRGLSWRHRLGRRRTGIKLGVTVRAFGLAEIARPASPAQYYTMVTRGNIERFMPPFASLNDQERWDVVAYALTMHTTPEQVARGKELFEKNCANCSTDYFKDQQVMSALTEVELARLIKQGNDKIPAFGADFNDDDLWACRRILADSLSTTRLPPRLSLSRQRRLPRPLQRLPPRRIKPPRRLNRRRGLGTRAAPSKIKRGGVCPRIWSSR